MQIGTAGSHAIAGMRVQTERLAQSAQNVANVNTDGYVARDSSAVVRGGGSYAAPATYGRFASAPALEGGEQPASTTDLGNEVLTQLTSLRAFQANLAVFETADAITGELVKMGA